MIKGLQGVPIDQKQNPKCPAQAKLIELLVGILGGIKKHGARLAVLDRYLRYMKYLVLAWAVGGSAYFGYMVFREYDPCPPCSMWQN